MQRMGAKLPTHPLAVALPEGFFKSVRIGPNVWNPNPGGGEYQEFTFFTNSSGNSGTD